MRLRRPWMTIVEGVCRGRDESPGFSLVAAVALERSIPGPADPRPPLAGDLSQSCDTDQDLSGSYAFILRTTFSVLGRRSF